jgi:hypothetical protein
MQDDPKVVLLVPELADELFGQRERPNLRDSHPDAIAPLRLARAPPFAGRLQLVN